MTNQTRDGVVRRQFLKSLAVSTGGVAAALVSGTPSNAASPNLNKVGAYQESEHVKKYYELARA